MSNNRFLDGKFKRGKAKEKLKEIKYSFFMQQAIREVEDWERKIVS